MVTMLNAESRSVLKCALPAQKFARNKTQNYKTFMQVLIPEQLRREVVAVSFEKGVL